MEPLEANPLHRLPSTLQAAALDCLERSGAVVMGNARAARWLRRLHADAQRAAGKRAWPTPPIHDWQSWLSILWKQHLQTAPDAPLLLTPVQERAIWKRIATGSVADSEAVAKLAAGAWGLLSDFNAHGKRNQSWSRSGRESGTSDAEVFRGWASTFDRECRTKRWISRSDLPALLTTSIRQAAIELPREILLAGFDRLTPSQQALIDAAQTTGVAVNRPSLSQQPNQPQLVQAKELRDELETCAWWARGRLEEDPSAAIAVIVQNIDDNRGEIERVFRRTLMPESLGIETNDAMPFEFSLGVPLASAPLVKAALLALRWLVEPLEQAAVSWLAISGFLAAEGDSSADMTEFDKEIRRRGRLPPQVPLEAFSRFHSHINSQTVHKFLRRLGYVQREALTEGVANLRKTFLEWIDIAEGLLTRMRWPGARTLESVEYQARARWERLLREVAGLGFDGGRVAWIEFVTVLDRYANETVFASESSGALIQIMGALESAGQEFDALWFVGADDRQWPPTGQPNPLLPLWLQYKTGMPHSSIDADWALNLAVTRRLAASAPECVFSHSLRDGTGELRPSALLAESFGSALPKCSSGELRAKLRVPAEIPPRCLTRPIADASSVPWPKEIAAGGADVLKRQSACAFQSFAVSRLGAEELGTAERGLTARDRGNIAHAVLQALWSKENPAEILIQSRDDLIDARSTGRLEENLRRHIADVFDREFGSAYRDSGWSSAYLQIEQARLHSVLGQWLDHEIKRAPFAVEEHEKDFLTQINGLRLNLRVDRIDRVDGGRLILDYKSGKVSPAMWEGERPDEPQLPLYGVHGPVGDLRGVLFAQVRAGDMGFKGRAEDAKQILSKDIENRSALVSNPLTQDTLDEWASALSNLAEQFLAGNAAVEPKQYPKTCRYCALPGLCRVAETLIERDVEDDEEGEDIAEGAAYA